MSSSQTMSKTGTQAVTRNSPCGCHDQPSGQVCCCNLICFDRPNYFCGHLLSDADLTMQQKYVVEKNKLFHRALDGHGVVCGLKLTCDCDCKGNIVIHDGFAIDDCGHDLVVCEATRFDVITALKNKNLLVMDLEEDDSDPRQRGARCEIKQCFYVTMCYEETESEYETPFQSGCTPGPKQCLPTRVHEGVHFDVTDKTPRSVSYIEELEKRIKDCFEISTDSPIGVIIKENAKEILEIFGEGQGEFGFDPCELFCRLRAYFLNHLRVKPSEYDCGLYEEIACLICPSTEQAYDRQNSTYREDLREAFGRLLYGMQRYQFDCVLGDLVFSCERPCESHCLVLGTVEVLNGKLVRVCNTPREYLWAPANLLQVLMYEVMTGSHRCKPEELEGREEEETEVWACCCPQYPKFNAAEFLREFEIDPRGRRFAAEAAVNSFREVTASLHRSFDFTDSSAYAPRLFAQMMDPAQKEGIAGKEPLGIHASLTSTPAAKLGSLNFAQAMMAKSLVKPGDAVRGYRSRNGVRVLPDYMTALSPDRSVGAGVERHFDRHTEQISELRAEIEALKKQIQGAAVVDTPKAAKKNREPKRG
jgi:hypothetical protein